MNKAPRHAPNESATVAASAPASAHELEGDACVDLLREAVDDEPGIVKVDLDTERGVMSFGYVPELVDRPDLDRIAHELAPTIQHKLETCTLRVGQIGGRACEACALGLEKRMNRMPGVRHASASYLGGVLSVTYDGALVSPGAIADRVKQYGVPLVPPAVDDDLDEEEIGKPRTLQQRMAAWLAAGHLAAVFTVITLLRCFWPWWSRSRWEAPVKGLR